MQEEVENRTVNLAVSTTKLTARTVMKGVRIYLTHRARVKAKSAAAKTAADNAVPHGKQTVQELIGQNQGVSAVPVASTELKGFERVAKKYGVDFAIRKDASHDPPRYTVFFKARDQAALDAAYREYSAQTLNKEDRPSVRKMLNRLIDQSTATPKKVREKEQERGGR